MDTSTLFHGLGYGAAYSGVGFVLLIVGYLILDLLTPGHLGSHLRPTADTRHSIRSAGSASAGLVSSAWLLAQGLIIFTAIWTNAASGFGTALVDTIAFGVMGIIALTIAYVVIDVLTPGRLGDAVCESGPVQPLAMVLAGSLLATAGIICASIA